MSSLPVKAREMIAAKSKKIAELSGSAVPRTAGNCALVLLGAGAGGAADEYLGEVAGMQPSTTGGIVLGLTSALVFKSPKGMYAATGLLTDAARQLGQQAAQKLQGE